MWDEYKTANMSSTLGITLSRFSLGWCWMPKAKTTTGVGFILSKTWCRRQTMQCIHFDAIIPNANAMRLEPSYICRDKIWQYSYMSNGHMKMYLRWEPTENAKIAALFLRNANDLAKCLFCHISFFYFIDPCLN